MLLKTDWFVRKPLLFAILCCLGIATFCIVLTTLQGGTFYQGLIISFLMSLVVGFVLSAVILAIMLVHILYKEFISEISTD